MSFMLGLVLISRRLRDLLFVVTGFTLGHSLTLALAVTGVLRPEAQYIDSLVALTIALIGAENIGDSTRHPLPVALGLGGLLFLMAGAKYLGALAELLVGFNLGVEIGQVTVVLGALAVAWVLVKARLGIPRPIFTDIAASFLVGEGLFWFLSRTVVEG
jgi:hypothetical protein